VPDRVDPERGRSRSGCPQRRDRAKLIELAILSKLRKAMRMWADAVVLVESPSTLRIDAAHGR
jgi:hypothetical protein